MFYFLPKVSLAHSQLRGLARTNVKSPGWRSMQQRFKRFALSESDANFAKPPPFFRRTSQHSHPRCVHIRCRPAVNEKSAYPGAILNRRNPAMDGVV